MSKPTKGQREPIFAIQVPIADREDKHTAAKILCAILSISVIAMLVYMFKTLAE